MSTEKLTGQQVSDAGLTGWVNLAGALETRIRTGDFATGLALLDQVGAAAEASDHHPDLDLRYGSLHVRLHSHDVGGLTARDVDLARQISELARAAGLEPDGAGLVRVELGLDTPDLTRSAPFWAALLGGSLVDDELVEGQGPPVWFQASGSEEPRQRWHPDLWVDPDRVQPLIDAATAAGGSLVSDDRAPSFWVLADPEGNRVCLCTWQERG
jgi:4a-hydroxytetrahydrobiopterin dehydratase